MSDYVIDPGQRPALPVIGRDARFPVHRVYCIGRNYADHAIEMGHDPDREPPFFFLKNPDNLDPSGIFPYPPESRDVHHEVEHRPAGAGRHGGAQVGPCHGDRETLGRRGVLLYEVDRGRQPDGRVHVAIMAPRPCAARAFPRGRPRGGRRW